MKKIAIVCLLAALLIFPCDLRAESEVGGRIAEIKDNILQDYKNFYSGENLVKLALGLGVSAILANTSADKEIRQWYQDEVRCDSSDDFGDVVQEFGDLAKTAPFFVGAVILGGLTKNTEFGSVIDEWGWRSIRTLIVGAPQLVLWQNALGSSRPQEGGVSRWRPFQDNNAASGHSFLGAVPFLSAAQMTDNFYLKNLFYAASTFSGISRINKDSHYTSQVVLGWWLAYLACSSVDNTEEQKFIITPFLLRDGGGVRLTHRF